MKQKLIYNPRKETYDEFLNRVKKKIDKCVECGIYYADPPSQLCPGCEAYKDHQQ